MQTVQPKVFRPLGVGFVLHKIFARESFEIFEFQKAPAPLNKALMRPWIQFSERDRCSLGPDELETQ